MGLLNFLNKQAAKSSFEIGPELVQKSTKDIKLVLLLILDGYGIAPDSKGNAISQAKKPYLDELIVNYPNGQLIASGESVGLPAGEVGNTKVGHLIMGAGRVILQDLKKINKSIEDESFYNKKAFLQAVEHIKKNDSSLHLIGLASSGKVHSSMEHLHALIKMAEINKIAKVYLHLFTDGRDANPKDGLVLFTELESLLRTKKFVHIATIGGRYFGMDRDRRWDRTKRAYDAMVGGIGPSANSATEAIRSWYKKGKTDEFIEPTVIKDLSGVSATIGANDAVIFFNYRVDRARQLSMALVLADFEKLKSIDMQYSSHEEKMAGGAKLGKTFKRSKVVSNLFFVSMIEYLKDFPGSVVFSPEKIDKTLSEIIANAGLKQLQVAESEKERFVKYYFRGLREQALAGEDSLIVASPNVSTYDKKPQMSIHSLTKELLKHIRSGVYQFVVVNFANCDMVAHSGNFKAVIAAVEHVDSAIAQLASGVFKVGGTMVVTADHSNAEELLGYSSKAYYFTTGEGKMSTDHSTNPVPVIVANKELRGKVTKFRIGGLADIAPTVLFLLGLEMPTEMTGRNLLDGQVGQQQESFTGPLDI